MPSEKSHAIEHVKIPATLFDWRAPLSDANLRASANATIFKRGQAYAVSGAVQPQRLVFTEKNTVISCAATVTGSHVYSTEISVCDDPFIDGSCDCPNAEDGHFCKHQVALALVLRDLLGGQTTDAVGEAQKKLVAAAKRAQTQARNEAQLLTFLQARSTQDLAQRLWQWAEKDRDLKADLKAWAAQSRADSDPKALTQAITELLKNSRQFLNVRDSSAYALRAGKVLALLRPLLAQDPVQLQALCEHALKRLFKVAEHADDSNGSIGELMRDIMALLCQALQAAPPPAKWYERWQTLQSTDPWGLWRESTVMQAAGPAVQAQWLRDLTSQWQAWQQAHAPGLPDKPLRPDVDMRRSASDLDWQRHLLRRRYLDALAFASEPMELLQAMRASAADASEHSELVAYCEKLGKFREALQAAQAAIAIHPRDHRCQADLLRCYERDGWDEEALALRRAGFEARPDAAHYKAVLAAAERAGRSRQAYRAELFDWAMAREELAAESGRLVSTRVEWLISEKNHEQALALVQAPNRCDVRLLYALATELPPALHPQAARLLQRIFELLMPQAKTPYSQELSLVRHILDRLPQVEGRQWLAYLHATYKIRRNFVIALPTH